MPTKPIVFLIMPAFACKQNWMNMLEEGLKDRGGYDHWIRPVESSCRGDNAILPVGTAMKVAQ